ARRRLELRLELLQRPGHAAARQHLQLGGARAGNRQRQRQAYQQRPGRERERVHGSPQELVARWRKARSRRHIKPNLKRKSSACQSTGSIATRWPRRAHALAHAAPDSDSIRGRPRGEHQSEKKTGASQMRCFLISTLLSFFRIDVL